MKHAYSFLLFVCVVWVCGGRLKCVLKCAACLFLFRSVQQTLKSGLGELRGGLENTTPFIGARTYQALSVSVPLSLHYVYLHGTGCTGSSGYLYSSLRLLVPQIEYDSLSLCILQQCTSIVLQCTPPLYYSVLQCTPPLYYSVHLHCTTVCTSIVLQ